MENEETVGKKHFYPGARQNTYVDENGIRQRNPKKEKEHKSYKRVKMPGAEKYAMKNNEFIEEAF